MHGSSPSASRQPAALPYRSHAFGASGARVGATNPGEPPVGITLAGKYRLLQRLGAGAMGTVYRAQVTSPEGAGGGARVSVKEVALKVLRADASASEAVNRSARARFVREAKTQERLSSPHTVKVFEHGETEDGGLYLAMELLEGESVGGRLRRLGRLPVGVAVDATLQALHSLEEAHALGVVHRDLKPDNLFFARRGGSAREAFAGDEMVKVLDFGIAKLLRPEPALGAESLDALETQAGSVFGTPRYMSPEQAQAKPLDPRSDLYSLGAILYQMLTGRPPFTDDDAVVVMARHIKTLPEPPSEACPEAGIPPAIERVVLAALAKEPDARPPTAHAFRSALLEARQAPSSARSGMRPLQRAVSAVLSTPLPSSGARLVAVDFDLTPAPPSRLEVTPEPVVATTDDDPSQTIHAADRSRVRHARNALLVGALGVGLLVCGAFAARTYKIHVERTDAPALTDGFDPFAATARPASFLVAGSARDSLASTEPQPGHAKGAAGNAGPHAAPTTPAHGGKFESPARPVPPRGHPSKRHAESSPARH